MNRYILRYLLNVCVIIIALAALGCTSPSSSHVDSYETIADYPTRDTVLAQQKNAAAVDHLTNGELEKAEQLIKTALAADVTYGPAHNNLGKIYYHKEQYYQAAWEFRYAMKLMPHQPEPMNNLGLVFEAVGRLDDAVAQYDRAREIQPDNPQIIGNLARARYRKGDRDPRMKQILTELIERDTRPEWVDWARQKLALLPKVKNDE